MSPSEPQAQALAWLRAELAHLEARNSAPTQQTIIRRMLARAVECGPILRDIWSPAHIRPTLSGYGGRVWRTGHGPDRNLIHWPDPDAHAQAIEEERARILLTLIATAAAGPQRAKDRRAARRELPGLLSECGDLAKQLHATLQAIQDHADRGGLMLPDHLQPGLLAIMIKAARQSPRNQGLSESLFEIRALPALGKAHDEHNGGAYWPDLLDILAALADVSAADLEQATEREPITRQAHALNDFRRALDLNLSNVWRTLEALKPWIFTHQAIADLAAVCLDLEPDEIPDDPRPRYLVE